MWIKPLLIYEEDKVNLALHAVAFEIVFQSKLMTVFEFCSVVHILASDLEIQIFSPLL